MSEMVLTPKDKFGMQSGTAELMVRTRGHQVLISKIERVEDPGFEDGWYKDYYFVQWTPLTALFFIHAMDDEITDIRGMGALAYSCGQCDEFMSYELIDGEAVAKTECQYTEGFTTVVEIDVPSGRLVCDDSLREAEGFNWKDEDETGFASYSSDLGQHQVVEFLAKTAGLAFAPVGNSCPGMWEVEPGKYVVGNAGYNEETDENEVPSFGGELINTFCTDLWAASMSDYDNFLARGGTPIEDDNQWGTRWVMDVPPGRYRMTFHGGEKGFDNHAAGEVIFAEFEKIADL